MCLYIYSFNIYISFKRLLKIKKLLLFKKFKLLFSKNILGKKFGTTQSAALQRIIVLKKQKIKKK